MIEIEYMKHDEPAKTSVGEVAGYGYERRQGPCGRLTSEFRPVAFASSRRTWTPACVREARDYLRGGSVCLFHVSCVITDGRRTRNGSTKHSFPRGGRPTESLVGMKHERVAAMRGRQCEHRLTLET